MADNKQIQIKVSDETLRGVYTNLTQVNHTKEEFIIDFLNILPPTGTLNARVILSPAHLKRVIKALENNLENYEKKFGVIELGKTPDNEIGFKTE